MKSSVRKARIPKPKRPAKPAVPALEWFCDLTGRSSRTTLYGNRGALIENHTGLLDFSDSRILLASHTGSLAVEGEKLSLSEVRENALMIHGIIHRVIFPQEGGPR